jgi:hypothetical protein
MAIETAHVLICAVCRARRATTDEELLDYLHSTRTQLGGWSLYGYEDRLVLCSEHSGPLQEHIAARNAWQKASDEARLEFSRQYLEKNPKPEWVWPDHWPEDKEEEEDDG